jgi:hypothetical protein
MNGGDVSEGMGCARCGRALKNADSILVGMGPVCAGKASRSDSGRLLNDQPVLEDVGTLEEVGLVCRRLADGRLACNVPQLIKWHSPTGFDCAYGGSGPADLALNVLHQLLPAPRTIRGYEFASTIDGVRVSSAASRLHQQFKWDFIASMGEDGGRVPAETIRAWIKEKLS